ncbi:hypothetical protein [Rhodococcus wratislaviensis]|uniref:Uncharacterized protein n=1 Tax=Rhodococcus wratislaviensis NBRC 100605 TaxID=1219028 RepID=X0R7G9_RHOWR|nr:hypothetical protein [Rhodococcus wratislaviensis]GAF46920.1 hypothetical protein RW1_035_00640 [Rhodococcus wratislaviensis NBRC 100605]
MIVATALHEDDPHSLIDALLATADELTLIGASILRQWRAAGRIDFELIVPYRPVPSIA